MTTLGAPMLSVSTISIVFLLSSCTRDPLSGDLDDAEVRVIPDLPRLASDHGQVADAGRGDLLKDVLRVSDVLDARLDMPEVAVDGGGKGETGLPDAGPTCLI